MSSVEQSVDNQLIEQTKRQIQALVAEIAQLSKQNLAPAQFYGEFLNRVVSALAAVGGAVWTTNDDGQLALQYHMNLELANLRDEESQMKHARLLYKALGSSEGMLVPPHTGFGDDDEAGNPTEFLLVLGPLRTDLEMVGLVEIFQRSEAGLNVQKGYLRFLLQMCDLATDFLKSHQLRHFSDRQVLWAKLEDFTRSVHTSLDPVETAYTIANEGRRLIECDRVSVALRKGNRCTIEAVSGQDVFDKRSNTVRLLGKLASAVVATGDPVWYAGDTRDLAPQVEDAVQEYVDEAHSKMIAILPLKRPPREEEDDPGKKEENAEQPIGALIVEQIEDSRVAPSLSQRVDVVCRHSATALANAVEHQSLFLMPVWRTIGKSRFLIKARTLPKTLSVVAAVLVILLVLWIWPKDFNLSSKGTLEPIDRQDVFAGVDGIVSEVKVEHGQMVKRGQPLIVLRNNDLEVAKMDIDGKMVATRQRVFSLQHALSSEGQLRPDERQRLHGELAEAQEQFQSYQSQALIYAEKIEQLKVVSPIDGQVVTWDLKNRLIQRPVQRGQLLLKVANPDGPWQLELHMSEDRMGHIAKAQQNLGEDLKVRYIVATAPGTERSGNVTEVQGSAEVRGEDGNTVLIKVAIDKDEVPSLRPGATVTAKVYCGRRTVGYVLFHDLLAFIQSRILFRIW